MLTLSAYRAKAILEGALSLIPGGLRLFRGGTRGSDSARYCYSVWMRHLARIWPLRMLPLDGTLVELGPGDSVGIGLAALLSGVRRYVAIDVVRHANVGHNLAVLDELVDLFRRREEIPGAEEFPAIRPNLLSDAFPGGILTADSMVENLATYRVAAIAEALCAVEGVATPVVELPVCYVDPAAASQSIERCSVDWVLSQAVLEHVDDLPGVYQDCFDWLKPGGLMSHQIDFESHGTSRVWNGHWVYPDPIWKLLRGRRPYLLNRVPCSVHLRQMADVGFEIITIEQVYRPSRLRKDQLARSYRSIVDDDLTTSSAFVVARKPAETAMDDGARPLARLNVA